MTKKTSKPKAPAGKTRKLKLKKETLKDLTERDTAARGVKGGVLALSGSCKASVCNSLLRDRLLPLQSGQRLLQQGLIRASPR